MGKYGFWVIEKKTAKLQSSTITRRSNCSPLHIKSWQVQVLNRYFITHIDRVNRCVASITKKFSSLTLFRELGITYSQSANTCKYCKEIYHDTLLKKRSDDLFTYFGIFVLEDKKCLSSIYWLSKLHNNPVKTIFVLQLQQGVRNHSLNILLLSSN